MATPRDVQTFLDAYLKAIREKENQQKFIEFLLDPDGPKHRKILGKIATADATTPHGWKIHYGFHTVDYYAQQAKGEEHKYLFHGTQSTLSILQDWKLFASDAVHGRGIYFGRNYYSSHQYAFATRTFKEAFKIRSIFIFRNDRPNLGLVSRDWEPQTYEYYLPGVDEYSLDSLEAIVFIESKDVQRFDIVMSHEPVIQKRLLDKGVKLYDQSLRPLDYDTVWKAFCRGFKAIPEVLDVDQELAFWAVGRKGFHLDNDRIYKMLLFSTKGDRELVKKVVRSALWDRNYSFIFNEVKNKIGDDDWLDLLFMGYDNQYDGNELEETLMWLMLKDEKLSEYWFRDLLRVKQGEDRLNTWMKKNRWLLDKRYTSEGQRKWDELKKLVPSYVPDIKPSNGY